MGRWLAACALSLAFGVAITTTAARAGDSPVIVITGSTGGGSQGPIVAPAPGSDAGGSGGSANPVAELKRVLAESANQLKIGGKKVGQGVAVAGMATAQGARWIGRKLSGADRRERRQQAQREAAEREDLQRQISDLQARVGDHGQLLCSLQAQARSMSVSSRAAIRPPVRPVDGAVDGTLPGQEWASAPAAQRDGAPYRRPFAIETRSVPAGVQAHYEASQADIELFEDDRVERQELVDLGGVLLEVAEVHRSNAAPAEGAHTFDAASEALDVATDVSLLAVPPASAAKSALQLVFGKNLITGRSLSGWEKGFEVANLVTLGGAGIFSSSAKVVEAVGRGGGAAGRVAAKLLDGLDAADRLARGERSLVRQVKHFLFPGEQGRYGSTVGALRGLEADRRLVERVGSVSSADVATLAHFGGFEGLLATRSPAVAQVLPEWGRSAAGFNQLLVHAFARNLTPEQGMVRLLKLESLGGFPHKTFSSLLSEPSQKNIETALSAFDALTKRVIERGELVQAEGGYFEYFLLTEHSSTTGVVAIERNGKRQTMYPFQVRNLSREKRRNAG